MERGLLLQQVDMLFKHAVTRQSSGALEEAVMAYRQVLQQVPQHLFALTNLAIALHCLHKPAQAEEACRQALAINPHHGEALNNLGIILGSQERYEEAIAAYQACVAQESTHHLAWNNLGLALSRLDRLEEAVAAFTRSLALQPDQAEALTQFIYHKMQMCDWQGLDPAIARLRLLSRQDRGEVNPFLMLFICRDPVETLHVAQRYGNRVVKAAAPPLPPPTRVQADTPLRLGYLSADFHPHATTALMGQLFESHDRRHFQVFAYSHGPDDTSPTRQRLVQACDRFTDVRLQGDRQIAEQIRQDGIHILVDLKGYTRDARSTIPAMRPAPLQINFLGYPGTMGQPFMDYILADQTVLPPHQVACFAEHPIWMPHSYQINDRLRPIHPSPLSRRQVGLPEQGMVFCCFNQSVKITPDVFALWLRLLQRVPTSVLWLLAFHPYAMNRLKGYAASWGVDPARLIFAPRWPLDRHLSRYRLADLFLDTLPCNGHTTASDALWAGCPVLTRLGDTFAGRVAASLLHALGLDRLITRSGQEYEDMAVELANQPDRLAALRQHLNQVTSHSPLFDGQVFTRNLEKGLAMAWDRYRQGLPPAPLRVPP